MSLALVALGAATGVTHSSIPLLTRPTADRRATGLRHQSRQAQLRRPRLAGALLNDRLEALDSWGWEKTLLYFDDNTVVDVQFNII